MLSCSFFLLTIPKLCWKHQFIALILMNKAFQITLVQKWSMPFKNIGDGRCLIINYATNKDIYPYNGCYHHS